MTHAQVAVGPVSTSAGTLFKVGNDIILPAKGDWLIHHVFAQMIMTTNAVNVGVSGVFQVESLEGAIVPDPAPGRFPLLGQSSQNALLGAGQPIPLQLFEVDWNAAGKATIRINATSDAFVADNPTIVGGIMYGKTRPETKPMLFATSTRGNITGTGEQFIGTIQLSERAEKITHIYPDFTSTDPSGTLFGAAVTIRLDSDDIDLTPFELPCLRAYSAMTQTKAGSPAIPKLEYISIDIDVVNGARINVFATPRLANPPDGNISLFLGYR